MYRCVFKCFRKVSTESQSLNVSSRLFLIDTATKEKALAPLAFFELFVAMRSAEEDRRSRVCLYSGRIIRRYAGCPDLRMLCVSDAIINVTVDLKIRQNYSDVVASFVAGHDATKVFCTRCYLVKFVSDISAYSEL